MRAGIAFLPADRQRDGVFAGLSVLKNLTALASTRSPDDGGFTIVANAAGCSRS